MLTQLTSTEAFWIVVDAVLAAGLVFVAAKYIRSRLGRRSSSTVHTVSQTGRRLVSVFDSMVREAGPEAAVAGSFRLMLSALLELDGGDYPAGMTVRELAGLGLKNLPDQLRDKLLNAYMIYEPVVYGGRQLSESMVRAFRDLLIEAEKIVEAHAISDQI